MITLYHGSYMSVPSPLTGVGRRELDFGPGFYVTNLREQAERWARRVCVIRAVDTPTLSTYEFDEALLPAPTCDFSVLSTTIRSGSTSSLVAVEVRNPGRTMILSKAVWPMTKSLTLLKTTILDVLQPNRPLVSYVLPSSRTRCASAVKLSLTAVCALSQPSPWRRKEDSNERPSILA